MLVFVAPTALVAALCNVPSGHASLAAAVADPACTDVVLAAGTLFEGSIVVDRNLSLQGQSSTASIVEGRIRAIGSSTELVLQKLTIDATASSVQGCFEEALSVEEGARVTTSDIVALATAAGVGPSAFCMVFTDGFESGTTSAWSGETP